MFPWCRERRQIVMLWVEWFGKWTRDWFERIFVIFFQHYEDVFAQFVDADVHCELIDLFGGGLVLCRTEKDH